VFSAVAALIIDRQLGRAALFAGVGAVLTFFGFMHGQHLGVNQNPTIAASYLMVAAFLAGCSVWAPSTPEPAGARAAEL